MNNCLVSREGDTRCILLINLQVCDLRTFSNIRICNSFLDLNATRLFAAPTKVTFSISAEGIKSARVFRFLFPKSLHDCQVGEQRIFRQV